MSPRNRPGLSFIEVLVLLAILVIGIGLLLPATRRIPEAADRSRCTNNLKQIMIGMHNYADTGRPLPPRPTSSPADRPDSGAFPTGCFGQGSRPEDRLSWMVAILPYVEQGELFRQFDGEKGFAGNTKATEKLVRIFQCPGGGGSQNQTNYVAMAGVGLDAPSRPDGAVGNGIMGYDRATSLDGIRDGASNTIALMETRTNLGPWARGGGSNLRGYDPTAVPVLGETRQFGGHGTSALGARADGSVLSVRYSTDAKFLADAITIAGGEVILWD